MKRTFFQFKTVFIYQVILWVFPFALTGFLGVYDPPRAKENWEMLLFIFAFSLLALNLPLMWLSLQRVQFTENAVLVKLGPLVLQKIALRDICMVDCLNNTTDRGGTCYYFFSTERLSYTEVRKHWNRLRIRNHAIIFCERGQKGLEETLTALFPTLFDPKHFLSEP